MPKDRHSQLRSTSRLLANSPLVKLRGRKSSEPEADVAEPSFPGTPIHEDQVHAMIDHVRRHNKRYSKELDTVQDAYDEKCQEVTFLTQQLDVYIKQYGILPEIQQMREALHDDDDDYSPQPSPEHFAAQQHFPGDLAHSQELCGSGQAAVPRDYRMVLLQQGGNNPDAPDANTNPLNSPRRVHLALTRRSSLNKSADNLTDSRSLVRSSSKQLVKRPEPEDQYVAVPASSLTKAQKKRRSLDRSNAKILVAEHKGREKSRIFRSQALFTIHNCTGLKIIYVSIYDKRRMGVGKHVRVSPVFEVGAEPLTIQKPFVRSTRTRFLLFVRKSHYFNESSFTMNPSLFRTLPSCNVDSGDKVYIYQGPDGALMGFPRPQSKSALQKFIQKKQFGSLRGSLRGSWRGSSQVSMQRLLAQEAPLVRHSLSLPQEELDFLEAREQITRANLRKFLDPSIGDDAMPRIAFCGSGGGCRAMMSTLGSLVGSQETDLLDCYTYVAGVSGSTWTLGLWESLGLSPQDLRENIIHKFDGGRILRLNKKNTAELLRTVRSNFTRKQKSDVLSVLDVYGVHLCNGLLNDTDPEGMKYKLHHQVDRVKTGEFPMPIYTAVQKEVLKSQEIVEKELGVKALTGSPQGTSVYHAWFEFTPFEVGCTDYEAFVPSRAFGRAFDLHGYPQDETPEPPFGTLLATFGSAFCAPLSRMAEEFFDKLEHGGLSSDEEDTASPLGSPAISSKKGDSKVKAILLEHKDQCTSLLHKMALTNYKMMAPARFSNFAYDPSKESTKQCKMMLELADAGIDCNLPFAPLLRPEREIDIIIACEASKSPNIDRGRSLRSAAEYARLKGLKFPPIDFDHTYDSLMSVFRDENDPTCPVIIYFPLKKNPHIPGDDKDFDPQENQRNGGYCSTFNFAMTEEQVQQLSGLTQFTFMQHADQIKEVIKQVAQAKAKYLAEQQALQEMQADAEEQELLQEVAAHADELGVRVACRKEGEEDDDSPRKLVFHGVEDQDE